MDTPVGVIEKGTVAAQRFTWQGTVDGEPVMTVRVNWLMGSENLDPPWTLGEQRFEVEFDADAAGEDASSTACTRRSSASTRRSA